MHVVDSGLCLLADRGAPDITINILHAHAGHLDPAASLPAAAILRDLR